MSLFVLCVMWENVTSLIKGQRVWEKWAVEETRYPESLSGSGIESEKGIPSSNA